MGDGLERARQNILDTDRRERRQQLRDLVARHARLAYRLRVARANLAVLDDEFAGLAQELSQLQSALEQDQTRATPALERTTERLPRPPPTQI